MKWNNSCSSDLFSWAKSLILHSYSTLCIYESQTPCQNNTLCDKNPTVFCNYMFTYYFPRTVYAYSSLHFIRVPSTLIIFYRAEQKYNLIYYYNNNKKKNKQMAWESECKWTWGRDMSGLQISEIVSQRSTHNTIVHNYKVVELANM